MLVINCAMCVFQVKALEEQINTSELKKQLMTLQRQTELLEEERKELQHKYTKAETEAKDLRFTGTLPGIRIHDLDVASVMLYRLSYRKVNLCITGISTGSFDNCLCMC